MRRKLLFAVFLALFPGGVLQAQRTIHYFGVYCNAYPGEAGGITVSQRFSKSVSPVAWGVEGEESGGDGRGRRRACAVGTVAGSATDLAEATSRKVRTFGMGVVDRALSEAM